MTYDRYTDARKKANRKYIKEKLDTITLFVPKGKRQIIKDAASRENVSMNQLIISAIEEKIHVSLHDES